MRIPFLALALVAVSQFHPDVAYVDGARDAMAKKAAEEFVATPIQEIWKDVYDAVVRRAGPKIWRRLLYAITGLISRHEVYTLSRHIMERVRKEVFQDRVNERMWRRMRMAFYYYLRDWWKKTPENPSSSAELGVWHALTNLHLEMLGPAMRGSPRVAKLNDVILDRDLKLISAWVSEWRGGSEAATPAVAEEKKVD